MSRFAKIPVNVPSGVTVVINEGKVKVTGPKGALERVLPRAIQIKVTDGNVTFDSRETSKFGESIKGTMRSHVVNMIEGVTNGWSKKLELQGTGYRAEVKGTDLVLTVGLSHPVIMKAPGGIKYGVEKNIINVDGLDKEVVGEMAARIRAVRLPDPYKGKGIRYQGQILKLKPGKQAAKAGAA